MAGKIDGIGKNGCAVVVFRPHGSREPMHKLPALEPGVELEAGGAKIVILTNTWQSSRVQPSKVCHRLFCLVIEGEVHLCSKPKSVVNLGQRFQAFELWDMESGLSSGWMVLSGDVPKKYADEPATEWRPRSFGKHSTK